MIWKLVSVLLAVGLLALLVREYTTTRTTSRAQRVTIDSISLKVARAEATAAWATKRATIAEGEVRQGQSATRHTALRKRLWRAEATLAVARLPDSSVVSQLRNRLLTNTPLSPNPAIAETIDDWQENARSRLDRATLARLTVCDSIALDHQHQTARVGQLEARTARQAHNTEVLYRHADALREQASQPAFLGIGRNRRVARKARTLPDTL
jgi:hypothetical protein